VRATLERLEPLCEELFPASRPHRPVASQRVNLKPERLELPLPTQWARARRPRAWRHRQRPPEGRLTMPAPASAVVTVKVSLPSASAVAAAWSLALDRAPIPPAARDETQ
jgi:hypothetical protein